MPAFAVIVFLSGGVPFLRVDLPESRDRSPGMMTPISMASSVAFVYSVGTVMVDRGEPLFWELVTLIGVLLSPVVGALLVPLDRDRRHQRPGAPTRRPPGAESPRGLRPGRAEPAG